MTTVQSSLTIKRSPTLWLFFALIICFGFFQLIANKPFENYLHFASISWEGGDKCQFDGNPILGQILCQTRPFTPQGTNFEIILKTSQSLSLKIQTTDSLWSKDFVVPPTIVIPEDKKFFSHYKIKATDLPQKELRLLLYATSSERLYLDTRIRINYLAKVGDTFNKIRIKVDFQLITALAIALVLVAIFMRYFTLLENNRFFFVLLFFMAFFTHWRLYLYYNWDEWNILDRFFNNGWAEVFSRHNEHFIPLFFTFYFGQVKIFGNFYHGFVLVSVLFLALNSFLLYKLLLKLSPWPIIPPLLYKLLALLYALNSLQGEGVQWALVQCTILSHTCCMLALISGINYLNDGKRKELFFSSLFLLVSALFFGNGFASVLCLALVALYLKFINNNFSWKHLAYLGLGAFLASVIAALLYLLNQSGTGHIEPQIATVGLTPAIIVKKIICYLLVGTQFGGVLRGVGLFPSLWPTSAVEILKSHIFLRYFPEITFALIGSLFSLFLLSVYVLSKTNRRVYLSLWLLGQGWVISAFILPALARWNFVYQQALSARYQHLGLVGIVLLLLPLVHIFYLNWQKKVVRYFSFCLIVFYLSAHFFMSASYDKYTSLTQDNYNFIFELKEWERLVNQANNNQGVSVNYELKGTPLFMLYPQQPQNFAAGMKPEKILRVLDWLQ